MRWVLETRIPIVDKEDKERIKKLKREGKLGKASKRTPHPEWKRGGLYRPGKKF